MGKRYPQRFKEIIKRYWKSRNEDEMLFLTASSTSSAEQDKLPKAHFHNTFTMSALEGGALPLSFKDHSVVLHPGEILIIGRKIPHMVEPIYKDEACRYIKMKHVIIARLLSIKSSWETISSRKLSIRKTPFRKFVMKRYGEIS